MYLAHYKSIILSICVVVLLCLNGCKNDIKSHDNQTQSSTSANLTQTTIPQNTQQESPDSALDFSQNLIDMFSILNVATKSNKTILLFFGSPFCLPCKAISNNITKSSDLQDVLKSNYQAYFIDISSKQPLNPNLSYLLKSLPKHTQTTQTNATQNAHTTQMSQKELALKLHIHATPTLIFLRESGEELFRFVGGISEQNLLAMLDFIKSAHSLNQQQIALELHLRFAAQSNVTITH